jgi:hypothetical protein
MTHQKKSSSRNLHEKLPCFLLGNLKNLILVQLLKKSKVGKKKTKSSFRIHNAKEQSSNPML